MIRFEGVHRLFEERAVLRNIDLQLVERRIGIIGANGSGKSTLARMINGLVTPSNGAVSVDGLDTKADGPAVRAKVGFVFQNPDNQIVFPVVEEDLAFGLKNMRLPKGEVSARVDDALGRYGLQDKRHARVHELSGGQKQLLAIAGVVAMEPKYIVFDEPTTLLDLRNRRRIGNVIDGLEQTVVLVTHDLDLLAEFERVLVIDEGRIVADERPKVAISRYVDLMGC